jgi:hypothetical protein
MMNKLPNIHEYDGKFYVCHWVESAGQWQRPLDADERRLTGCHTEFSQSINDMPHYDECDNAVDLARRLYGYSKLAR